MMITFPCPPESSAGSCTWTGEIFRSGSWCSRILSYRTGSSGWTDNLTTFHEETAGSDHYIDVASRENAFVSLKKHLHTEAPLIMDVGCSSGLLLALLKERLPSAQLIGADYIRGPLEAISQQFPDIPLLQFDLASCPLQDNFLDAVVALNVLEHIEDDAAAIRHIHRMLKPQGVAVIEVPAGPALFDLYDQELMHYRRYRMSKLLNVVRQAGFKIVDSSHLGFFLYPAFAAVKLKNRFLKNVAVDQRKAVVAGNIQKFRQSPAMTTLLRIEAALRPVVTFPFGIRCLVVCTK